MNNISIEKIFKRDFNQKQFELEKITDAILKAMLSVKHGDVRDAEKISNDVYQELVSRKIDIEYKEIAEKAGIKNFRRVKALNTHPTFIQGLSDLVISCLEEPVVNIEEASQLPEKVKLYPQEKWQWGWNNSSEVWNGRVAMIVFLVLFIELISGSGPLHRLGIL